MEQSASDFNLKEWNLKPRSTCENTKLRRFSSSSFRQDAPTPTISSTVSSPGYTIREEIDPSTYSFTAAIRALQARAVCSWEYLPQQRLTLHSKWSDAEKYISNPLSGEVPLECLSAKTLAGARSFSTLSNRITVSHLQHFHPIIQHQQHKLNITIQAEKDEIKKTRDVGIQSSLPELSSSSSRSSPSPIQTPSIEERSCRKKLISVGESGDSSSSSSTSLCIDKEEKPEAEVEERETNEKEGRKTKEEESKKKKKKMMMMMCSSKGGGIGCLSLKGLWQREKCKPRKKNNIPKSSTKTFFHINSCYDQ